MKVYKPREAQRHAERPREPGLQRSPEEPRGAPEKTREAQRSPKRPRDEL